MKAQLYCVKIPLKQPFMHAAHIRRYAESLILVIEHEGVTGIGECAPRNYVTGETVDNVFESMRCINLNALFEKLADSNLDVAVYALKASSLYHEKAITQNVRCMLEMALLDWLGNYYNTSLSTMIRHYFLNDANQDKKSRLNHQIKTTQVLDLSIPVSEFLEKRGPFHTIKIKAFADKRNNIHNIQTVRQALGNDIPIIIDANMAWNLETAQDNIDMYSAFNVAYYEEPLAKHDWKNYQRLRQVTSAKIMLDESLCSLEDAHLALSYNAADAFNIRLAKCGGISNAIELIKFAKAHGIAFQIGAQVAEVGPLIAAGRHLAAVTLGYFTFEAGQADRQFDGSYVVSPMPLVNRTTNLASALPGDGLGVSLTSNLALYSQKQGQYDKGQWL